MDKRNKRLRKATDEYIYAKKNLWRFDINFTYLQKDIRVFFDAEKWLEKKLNSPYLKALIYNIKTNLLSHIVKSEMS